MTKVKGYSQFHHTAKEIVRVVSPTSGVLGCKLSFVTIKKKFHHKAKEIVSPTSGVLSCKVSFVTIKKEFHNMVKETVPLLWWTLGL